VLQKARDVLAVVAMTVAHTKEVTVAELKHMWVGQVGILVLLVGVVRSNSTFGSEGELGD
jgi:hypothetical protein